MCTVWVPWSFVAKAGKVPHEEVNEPDAGAFGGVDEIDGPTGIFLVLLVRSVKEEERSQWARA